jgi:hypothetical protein
MKRQIIITEEENKEINVGLEGVESLTDAISLLEVGKILLCQKAGLLQTPAPTPAPKEPKIIHVTNVPGKA